MSHKIDVTLDSTEINTPVTEDIVSSNSHVVCADSPQEVLAVKKEYSIVGDLFYAGINSEVAPAWLTNLITSQVDVAVDNGLVDYDLLVQDVRNAIDSIDVAANTYVEQINFTSDVDSIVGTHLATLNVTNDNKYATIVNLDIVAVDADSALTLSTTDLRAEFTADINSRATTIETAFASEDAALANSITALTTAFTDQETSLSGTANAVSGLQTYVGLDGTSFPNGTGMLARIGLVEKQTDGLIDYITNTYDVMSGIEDPNTDTSNDLLIVDALPYALWVDMSGAGVPVATDRDYMDYSLPVPVIDQATILENTLYERSDFTDVDVDKYYKYVANSWTAITTADYLLDKESLRSAHTADVYIQYSTNSSGIKSYIKGYKFIKTTPDTIAPFATDAEGYGWSLIIDTDAQSTYIAILNARAAADGKISQFYAWGGTTAPADYTVVTRPIEYDADENGNFLDINGDITVIPAEYVVIQAEEATTVSADDFYYWLHDDLVLYRKGPTGWGDEEPVPTSSGNGTYISEGDVLTAFDTHLVDGEPANDLIVYSFNGTTWQLTGPGGIISTSRFFVDLNNAVRGPAGLATAVSNLEITSSAYTDQETALVENKFNYNSELVIDGLYYKSGFGLDSSGITQVNDGLTSGTAFDSEFWINAERLVLKSPTYPGISAVFNVSATGISLGIEYTDATRNTPRGAHIFTDAYDQGDMVTSSGSSYIALIDVPANTAITDVTYWEIMALGGGSATYTSTFDDVPSQDGLILYSGTKSVSVDSFSGTSAMELSSNIVSVVPNGSGDTAYVTIPENLALSFAGRNIDISMYVKQGTSPSTEFALSYSTSDNGNSGFQVFTPTSTYTKFSFEYLVPIAITGGTDFLIIDADTSGSGNQILIDNINISIVSTDGSTIYEIYEYSPDGIEGAGEDWSSDLRVTDFYRRTALVTNGAADAWSVGVAIRTSIVYDVYEYSINGTTLWHDDYLSGDIFRRTTVYTDGVAGTPSVATQITGEGALATLPVPFSPGLLGGSGDFIFTLNMLVGGVINNAELRIQGSRFQHPDGTDRVLQADTDILTPYGENESGRFYLMWTEENRSTRFASGGWGNATNIIPIRDVGGVWKAFDNVSVDYDLTIVATDCLLAVVEAEASSSGLTGIIPYVSGYTPILGTDYFTTDGSFKSYVYLSSASAGGTPPNDGTFDGTTETAPTGWDDNPTYVQGQETYVSTGIYEHDPVLDTWSNTGWSVSVIYSRDGVTPVLGTDYFVTDGAFKSYVFITSVAIPTDPSGGSFTGTAETPPSGWSDDPYYTAGQVTWVATSLYTHNAVTGIWSNNGWSTPAEYSVKGDTGDSSLGSLQTTFSPGLLGGSGDFIFTLNMTSLGVINDGEIRIQGSRFIHPDGTERVLQENSQINTSFGDSAGGSQAGRFYLVWSDEDVATRLPGRSAVGSATNIFGMQEVNGTWEAIDNTGSNTFPFTILATDCILAAVEAKATTGGLTGIVPFVSGVVGLGGVRGTAVLTYGLDYGTSVTAPIEGVSPVAITIAQLNDAWTAAASADYLQNISGDTLILTNTSSTDGWTHIYEHDGTTWTSHNTFRVNGNQVVTGTLSAGAIGAGALILGGSSYDVASPLIIKNSADDVVLELNVDTDIMSLNGTLSADTININAIQESARVAINPYYLVATSGALQEDATTVTNATPNLTLNAVTTSDGKAVVSWKLKGSGSSVGGEEIAPVWVVEVRRDNNVGTLLNSGATQYTGYVDNNWVQDYEGFEEVLDSEYGINIEGLYVDDLAPANAVYHIEVYLASGPLTTISRTLFRAESPSFVVNDITTSGGIVGYSWSDKETGFTVKSGSLSCAGSSQTTVNFDDAFTTIWSATTTADSTLNNQFNYGTIPSAGFSNSSINIRNNSTIALTFRWIATGYTLQPVL